MDNDDRGNSQKDRKHAHQVQTETGRGNRQHNGKVLAREIAECSATREKDMEKSRNKMNQSGGRATSAVIPKKICRGRLVVKTVSIVRTSDA